MAGAAVAAAEAAAATTCTRQAKARGAAQPTTASKARRPAQGNAQVRGGGHSLDNHINAGINTMLYQLAAAKDSILVVIGQL